ncbi:MAG TPA: hypothetical protein EYG68_07320 [Leucothrix mucor]|nr:hypothetical protein [Leucothrix mucor]
MSKLSYSVLLALTSLLLLSACGSESNSVSSDRDQHTNLLEFELKTLEQAKDLEGTLHNSFNERLGSLQ